jgi:hypothetical protein
LNHLYLILKRKKLSLFLIVVLIFGILIKWLLKFN